MQAKPRDVAKLLGVSERTLRGWKAAGSAPRMAMLALYWESRWGRSQDYAEAYNTAQVHRQLAESLARENQRLALALHSSDTMGGETANSPSFYRA